MHIMIVEDDEAISEVYSLILSEEYMLSMYNNAQVALNALATIKPDLIILDWLIPGMNGAEFLGKMRECRYVCPVLVVTATAGCKRDVEAWGATLLEKPFDIDELLDKVEAMLPMLMEAS